MSKRNTRSCRSSFQKLGWGMGLALLFVPMSMHAQWQVDLRLLHSSLNGIDALDGQTIMTVGSDQVDSFRNGQAFKSVDAGLTWDSVLFTTAPGTSRNLYQTEWLDDQTVIISSFRPALYVSFDAGASWDERTVPDGPGAAMDLMHWRNADTGFVGNLEGRLYKTTDGGDTWSNVFIAGGFTPVYDLDCPTAETCYMRVNGEPGVYKSTDAGNNWTVLPNAPISYFSGGMDAITEDTVLVVGSGKAFRSIDGGANWTMINMPTENTYSDVEFVGAFGVAVGSRASIAHSYDYGASWSLEYIDTTGYESLWSVSVLNDSAAWATSTWGSIYRLGASAPTALTEPTRPSLQIGPNPSTGRFWVQLPETSTGYATLFNAWGQAVDRAFALPGERVVFQNVPPGWYWCAVALDNDQSVGSAVLVKP